MAPTTRSKQPNGASLRDTKPQRNVREDAAGSQEADSSDLNMIEVCAVILLERTHGPYSKHGSSANGIGYSILYMYH